MNFYQILQMMSTYNILLLNFVIIPELYSVFNKQIIEIP